MRAFFGASALLVVALAACVALLVYNAKLRVTVAELEGQISLLNSVRTADNDAIRTSNAARDAAAERAKEQRDALQIPPNASDDDVLDACRDSLCTKGAAGGRAAPGQPSRPLPAPDHAGSDDARQYP